MEAEGLTATAPGAEPLLDVALFTQRVGDLAFDPGGRWLAAASWDGRARLLALP